VGGLYSVAGNSGDLLENVVSGDFNRDGNLDLMAFDVSSSNYVLFLGNGDGTFQPSTSIASGYYETALVAADLNHDGKLDLVTGQMYGGVIQVILGNGNGTFQPPVQYIAGFGSIESLAVADLNHDNNLDVVAMALNGDVEILLGNGDGTLQPAVGLPTNSPYPFSVAVGDMNNDGKPDIVVGEAGAIDVFLGNGDGTFQTPIQTAGGSGNYYLTNVALADLNGDKKLDVIAGGAYSVTVWLGNGNGTFRPSVRSFADGYFPGQGLNTLLAADFNNDGKIDLVTVPESQTLLSIYSGNGDGTFAAGSVITVGTPSFYTGVVSGDFNHDNKSDFVVANESNGTVELYFGNGKGGFSTAKKFTVGSSPQQIATGDFNGDGNPDIAVTNQLENTVSILLGTGTGSFRTQHKINTGSYPYGIATADVNHDGKLDLIVGTDDVPTNVQVFLGNGNGTFQPPTSWGDYGGNNTTVAVADLNGDGNLDIAATTSSPYGMFSVLFGDGNGNFSNTIDTTTYSNGEYSIATGVLNPNGPVDVIFGTSDGIDVVSSTNLGTTGLAQNYFANPCLVYSLTVGDFNGDGFPDVVGTCEAGTALYTGKGDGTIGSVANYATSYFLDYSFGVTAADFNSDGVLDLVVTHESGNITTILSNPVLVFSALRLNFGKVNVGTTSTKSFTLVNQSNTKLIFTSIAITGVAASDYIETNTCGASLAAGRNCKVTVTFKPSVVGTRSASVTFTDSAAGPARNIPLSGVGQ
jgi:hypothetical protein